RGGIVMHVQADEQDPANGERAVMTGPSRVASTGAAHDGILAWRQRADLRLDIELRFTTLGIGTAHAAQSPFWESRGVVLALRPMLGRLCIAMDDLAAQGRHECLPPETY